MLWDNAVAEVMGWDPEELARLRNLLHNEPHVRGLGYNQYADELEESEGMERLHWRFDIQRIRADPATTEFGLSRPQTMLRIRQYVEK